MNVKNAYKNLPKSIRILITLFLILFFVDITNLPSLMMPCVVANLNTGFWKMILPICVTISLFTITYKTIDENQRRKEENRKQIALRLAELFYDECLKTINLLNEEYVQKKILEYVDFNEPVRQTPFYNRFISPVKNLYESMQPFINDGVLDYKAVSDIMKIYNETCSYTTLVITIFDHPEIYANEQNKLKRQIIKAKTDLNRKY